VRADSNLATNYKVRQPPDTCTCLAQIADAQRELAANGQLLGPAAGDPAYGSRQAAAGSTACTSNGAASSKRKLRPPSAHGVALPKDRLRPSLGDGTTPPKRKPVPARKVAGSGCAATAVSGQCSESDLNICEVCGSADFVKDSRTDPRAMLLCHGTHADGSDCPRGGHLGCLKMPRVPPGRWFCKRCSVCKVSGSLCRRAGGSGRAC